MKTAFIYRSYATWFLPTIILMFLMIPLPILNFFNAYVSYFYVAISVFISYFIFLRRFYFYPNRLEILYLLRNQRKIIYFEEIQKIQFRLGIVPKSPPHLAVITKNNPQKPISLAMFNEQKTKALLDELHKLNLKIEFLAPDYYIKKIKGW